MDIIGILKRSNEEYEEALRKFKKRKLEEEKYRLEREIDREQKLYRETGYKCHQLTAEKLKRRYRRVCDELLEL